MKLTTYLIFEKTPRGDLFFGVENIEPWQSIESVMATYAPGYFAIHVDHPKLKNFYLPKS